MATLLSLTFSMSSGKPRNSLSESCGTGSADTTAAVEAATARIIAVQGRILLKNEEKNKFSAAFCLVTQ